jgi:hypothetical protein
MKQSKTIIGKFGWDMGCRFRIVGTGRIGCTLVCKLRVTDPKKRNTWIEYKSYAKLCKERCFDYNWDGSFLLGRG